MAWNFTNDRPIYMQIVDRLTADIISGRYNSGDKIPSVRDIAMEASVNPNTVQKSLSELERLGIIYTQRNNGRYVTDDQNIMKVFKYKTAKTITTKYIAKMCNMGYSLDDIRKLLDSVFEEGSDK